VVFGVRSGLAENTGMLRAFIFSAANPSAGTGVHRGGGWTVTLGLSVALLVGCGSPVALRPPPVDDVSPSVGSGAVRTEPVAPDHSVALTLQAMGLVGTPYRYGGNTPDSGFDCSGLIAYVHWHAARIRTPRSVAELSGWGEVVPLDGVRTGDLAVFTLKGRTSHAGIYVGNGRFVHAPSTGGTVRLDRLDSGYWARQGVTFRRPLV